MRKRFTENVIKPFGVPFIREHVIKMQIHQQTSCWGQCTKCDRGQSNFKSKMPISCF